jgi:hypothetical protein
LPPDASSERAKSQPVGLRERGIGPWEQQWHEAEDWYFQHAAPDRWFDIIVENQ